MNNNKSIHSDDITFEEFQDRINYRLMDSLNESEELFESGIQKIRSILNSYQIDIPALYEMDRDGDELAIQLEETDGYLYLIYCLNEDNQYEFHAEIVSEEQLNDIISEAEEDIEE